MDEAGQRSFVQEKDYDFWIPEEDKQGNPITKAMDQIIETFDKLSDIRLMAKLTRWLSQNTNESVHFRLFNIISKTKYYKYNHINFAAWLTAIIHNNSYENAIGRLYSHIGSFTEEEKVLLMHSDGERKRNSTEKHQKIKKDSRFKHKTALRKMSELKEINYSAGFGFEDYEIDGVAEFERRLDDRDDLEKDFIVDDEHDKVDTDRVRLGLNRI